MSIHESGRLTRKGQLTVPAEIRKQLNLQEGDRLTFEIRESGEVYVVPRKTVRLRDVAGLLKSDLSIDVERAREVARQALAAKHAADDKDNENPGRES